MKDAPVGVSMIVLNIDKSAHEMKIPLASLRLTLSSPTLLSQGVFLNGRQLTASSDGTVPTLVPEKVAPGLVSFAPEAITVLTMPSAKNQACRP